VKQQRPEKGVSIYLVGYLASDERVAKTVISLPTCDASRTEKVLKPLVGWFGKG
jgi:hypothetical protein